MGGGSIHSVQRQYNPSLANQSSLSLPDIPKNEKKMRLIYTKSGFYSKEPETHGFFAILSKSIENVNVFIAWIPEYLIEPDDVDQFIRLDGMVASDEGYPEIQVNLGEGETMMIMLRNVYSLHIRPPSDGGFIVITLKTGDELRPLYYLSEAQWPGFDIIDVIDNFSPLQALGDIKYQFLVGSDDRLKASGRLEGLGKITQGGPRAILQLKGSKLNEHQMASQYLSHYGRAKTEYLLGDLESPLTETIELQSVPVSTRRPISKEEWTALLDTEGRLSHKVRQLIFERGLTPEVRQEGWKFLLGIYPWQSTLDERKAIWQSRVDAYYRIKALWFDHLEVRESSRFEDEKRSIDKDVHRTDREQDAFRGEDRPSPEMALGTNSNLETLKDILVTYNFYNTELGYVQGMSDLLAPIFVVMEDEVAAFWGFAGFMDKVQHNFYMDQSGMYAQLKMLNHLIQFMDPVLYKRLEEIDISNLLFCFRWLLVWFKREFEWEDLMKLWEVLWTNALTDKMILFFTLAVIDTHRNAILNDLNEFDEVLRYMMDLNGKIDLNDTVKKAEILFYQFEGKIRAMQVKSNTLKEKLGERSVWNSEQRHSLQKDIDRLKIPEYLFELLPKQ